MPPADAAAEEMRLFPDTSDPVPSGFAARRLANHPVIHRGMLDTPDAGTINCPSLIRVPAWLPDSLGRYYLYFSAHGNCRYIRLAYADKLAGPWRIHAPGTLRLDHAPACKRNVASPDVHVDDARKQIRMYFQGISVAEDEPRTFVATSADGLTFAPRPEPLALFYFRAVPWKGIWIGMSKGGRLYRSDSGLTAFRQHWLPAFRMRSSKANRSGDSRHVALHIVDNMLFVYHSRVGDAPERILRSRIDLDDPPWAWRARRHEVIMQPEFAWEGAVLPVRPSSSGAARQEENALRDPAVYIEDGRTYLAYAVAGEAGIGIAELVPGTRD